MKTQILRYPEIQDQKTHKLEVRRLAPATTPSGDSTQNFELIGLLYETDTAMLMTKAAKEMQALVKRELEYDISSVEVECFAGMCKFKNVYSALAVIIEQYRVEVLGELPEPSPDLSPRATSAEEVEMMKQLITKGDDDMRQMIDANNKLLTAHKNLEREYLLQKGNIELLVVQNKEFLERIQAFEEGQKSLEKFKVTAPLPGAAGMLKTPILEPEKNGAV